MNKFLEAGANKNMCANTAMIASNPAPELPKSPRIVYSLNTRQGASAPQPLTPPTSILNLPFVEFLPWEQPSDVPSPVA